MNFNIFAHKSQNTTLVGVFHCHCSGYFKVVQSTLIPYNTTLDVGIVVCSPKLK